MRTYSTTKSEVQTQTINKKKKSVGIYGGTFNPPHIAHLIAAQQVLDQLGLDEIWFLPNNIPPHVDKKETISTMDRIEMVRLAIEDNSKFKLDLTDINRGGVSYTFETMRMLTEANPTIDFYFIIGGDMVEYLPKWKKIDELINMVKFVGVCRPGYEKVSKYPVIWVNSPELEISSTDIRKKVMNKQTIKYLVPKKVEEYIQKEGLYHD